MSRHEEFKLVKTRLTGRGVLQKQNIISLYSVKLMSFILAARRLPRSSVRVSAKLARLNFELK